MDFFIPNSGVLYMHVIHEEYLSGFTTFPFCFIFDQIDNFYTLHTWS